MRMADLERQYKPVECNGIVYRCASDAASIEGVSTSAVVACCKGQRPSVNGLEFRYARRGAKPTFSVN